MNNSTNQGRSQYQQHGSGARREPAGYQRSSYNSNYNQYSATTSGPATTSKKASYSAYQQQRKPASYYQTSATTTRRNQYPSSSEQQYSYYTNHRDGNAALTQDEREIQRDHYYEGEAAGDQYYEVPVDETAAKESYKEEAYSKEQTNYQAEEDVSKGEAGYQGYSKGYSKYPNQRKQYYGDQTTSYYQGDTDYQKKGSYQNKNQYGNGQNYKDNQRPSQQSWKAQSSSSRQQEYDKQQNEGDLEYYSYYDEKKEYYQETDNYRDNDSSYAKSGKASYKQRGAAYHAEQYASTTDHKEDAQYKYRAKSGGGVRRPPYQVQEEASGSGSQFQGSDNQTVQSKEELQAALSSEIPAKSKRATEEEEPQQTMPSAVHRKVFIQKASADEGPQQSHNETSSSWGSIEEGAESNPLVSTPSNQFKTQEIVEKDQTQTPHQVHQRFSSSKSGTQDRHSSIEEIGLKQALIYNLPEPEFKVLDSFSKPQTYTRKDPQANKQVANPQATPAVPVLSTHPTSIISVQHHNGGFTRENHYDPSNSSKNMNLIQQQMSVMTIEAITSQQTPVRNPIHPYHQSQNQVTPQRNATPDQYWPSPQIQQQQILNQHTPFGASIRQDQSLSGVPPHQQHQHFNQSHLQSQQHDQQHFITQEQFAAKLQHEQRMMMMGAGYEENQQPRFKMVDQHNEDYQRDFIPPYKQQHQQQYLNQQQQQQDEYAYTPQQDNDFYRQAPPALIVQNSSSSLARNDSAPFDYQNQQVMMQQYQRGMEHHDFPEFTPTHHMPNALQHSYSMPDQEDEDEEGFFQGHDHQLNPTYSADESYGGYQLYQAPPTLNSNAKEFIPSYKKAQVAQQQQLYSVGSPHNQMSLPQPFHPSGYHGEGTLHAQQFEQQDDFNPRQGGFQQVMQIQQQQQQVPQYRQTISPVTDFYPGKQVASMKAMPNLGYPQNFDGSQYSFGNKGDLNGSDLSLKQQAFSETGYVQQHHPHPLDIYQQQHLNRHPSQQQDPNQQLVYGQHPNNFGIYSETRLPQGARMMYDQDYSNPDGGSLEQNGDKYPLHQAFYRNGSNDIQHHDIDDEGQLIYRYSNTTTLDHQETK